MSDVHDLTVTVLREIRDGIGGVGEQLTETNRRLDRNQEETNRRLDGLGERLDRNQEETSQRLDGLGERLDGLNERLDNVIDIAGGAWRSHEQRFARLEYRVDRLERRNAS